MSDASEHSRLIGELLRFGTVAEVTFDPPRCVVRVGELVTGPLPWAAFAAGDIRIWRAPTVGEQVVLCCPEGDVEAGFVIPGFYSADFPPPSADPDRLLVQFKDGAEAWYDQAAGELVVATPGKVRLEAASGVEILGDLKVTGAVEIEGDVSVTGGIEATEDVAAGDVSLKTHVHTGVQTGPGNTGAPL